MTNGSSKSSSVSECDEADCILVSAAWEWNGSSWVETSQCPDPCTYEEPPGYSGSFVGEEYIVPCGCA